MGLELLQDIDLLKPQLEKTHPDTGHKRQKVIVIAGPTASGKSELSMLLAKKLSGEIVSADSVQVYRHMDIGTAKVSYAERMEVAHHLIDIRDVTEEFNVVDYFYLARSACQSILARSRVPIVVGGTGFYLHTLLYGPPEGPPSVPQVRLKIEEEWNQKGPQLLFEKLQKLDPDYSQTISIRDRTKIIRALEIMHLTGQKVSSFLKPRHTIRPMEYDFRCWFIFYDRPTIYERIEVRCDQMLGDGLLEEVKKLEMLGLRNNRSASQAIGYKQALEYLEKERANGPSDALYQEFVRNFKTASRHLAKRQFTWFRQEPAFRWVSLEDHELDTIAELIAQDYLMR